ncbi:hypothetical protein B0H10DRAFT_2052661, partial [Mycena sp. CBHHK59/15]
MGRSQSQTSAVHRQTKTLQLSSRECRKSMGSEWSVCHHGQISRGRHKHRCTHS